MVLGMFFDLELLSALTYHDNSAGLFHFILRAVSLTQAPH